MLELLLRKNKNLGGNKNENNTKNRLDSKRY